MANVGPTAIQYMAMIMKAQKFKLQYVLQIVQIINNSYLSSKDIIQILQQIFKNEKSSKILVAVNVLEYLVKNCNRNFHQAANRQSFQKSILGLLKRQRGKTNILKDIRSNTQNWSRIQAKTLYLIQLWYDAFILEESKYQHIINTYKVIRKQNIIFPPRNVNEKNLMVVKTQSPIFDNIETIAQTDKIKFNKRLKAMGMPVIEQKVQKQKKVEQPVKSSHWIDIDDISQKIAIIQSQEYEGDNVLPVIQKLKKDLEYGKIRPQFQKYWGQIKQAAQLAITEWQQKNAELVNRRQMEFQAKKLQRLDPTNKQEKKSNIIDIQNGNQEKIEPVDKKQKKTIDLMDNWDLLGVQEEEQKKEQPPQQKITQQINLLDL